LTGSELLPGGDRAPGRTGFIGRTEPAAIRGANAGRGQPGENSSGRPRPAGDADF